ncbi:hypothetical protein D3C81_1227880 [compost metagenome]
MRALLPFTLFSDHFIHLGPQCTALALELRVTHPFLDATHQLVQCLHCLLDRQGSTRRGSARGDHRLDLLNRWQLALKQFFYSISLKYFDRFLQRRKLVAFTGQHIGQRLQATGHLLLGF